MDIKLLLEEFTSFGLTLISPTLYELSEDKSTLIFHDEERSDLFFIHLNEFIYTKFNYPINGTKNVSLFELMEDFCAQYEHIKDFKIFLKSVGETKEYFFKKRYYTYYISPHNINFEISFAELINIQSNYSKHSYFHLSQMKKKLKDYFKSNDIKDFEKQDYNEHLGYFKEAVLDDRLNFNQTHIVEQLGKLFLAYWELLNSCEIIIKDITNKEGKTEKPKNLNEIEEFYRIISKYSKFKKKRIIDFTPITCNYLIEKETTKINMLTRNRMKKF